MLDEEQSPWMRRSRRGGHGMGVDGVAKAASAGAQVTKGSMALAGMPNGAQSAAIKVAIAKL